MNEQNNGYETYEFSENKSEIKEVKKGGENKIIKGFRNVLVCATLGLVFGICGGLGLQLVNVTYEEQEAKEVSSEKTSVLDTPTITSEIIDENEIAINEISTSNYGNIDIINMVNNTMPAMVSIENTFEESVSYFGQVYKEEGLSNGSGFIVGQNETELLIVTNHHVIEDAVELRVYFIDGTSAIAQVKGSDAETDLAVIAVQIADISTATESKISIVPMGDSDELQLGEYVVAIGNALGYGQSVTDGIVSALNREVEMENGYTGNFIQTNAEINFGNSGGALLNSNGEVIGINSSKLNGDGVEGMGYAIPISLAKPILEELMLLETKVKVADENRGYMGISYQIVDEQTAEVYGWEQGLYVRSVEENGAAGLAGILKGDIITSVNGVSVTSTDKLESVMQYCAAGDLVEVEVLRGDNSFTIEFRLNSQTQ